MILLSPPLIMQREYEGGFLKKVLLLGASKNEG